MSLRSPALLLAALASACATSATDRALVEAQRRLDARDWAGAIERLETITKTTSAVPEEQVSAAYRMISRAEEAQGRLGRALRALDQARMLDSWKAAPTERRQLQERFLSALARAPASAQLHLRHRDELPEGYRLSSVLYEFDEQTAYAWQRSMGTAVPAHGAIVLARALSAGEHYLQYWIRYDIAPLLNYRFTIRSREVIECRAGHVCDVSITLSYRGTPPERILDSKELLADSEKVEVRVNVQQTPIGPTPPAATPPPPATTP